MSDHDADFDAALDGFLPPRLRAPAVARFPANTKGVDYVVADVHGAYSLLWSAMKAAQFDPSVDRLFVVGDLVNRGPESLRANRLLQLPYVHAVSGNHEGLWSTLYEGGPPDETVVKYTMRALGVDASWWFAAPPAERDELVGRFASLPIAIEIETERGLVGLVHAEVPIGMAWPRFTELLEAGDRRTIQQALWGRTRAKRNDETWVHGVGRIFSGHTPSFGGARRLGNTFQIDTGAVFGLLGKGDPSDEPGRLMLASLTCATQDLLAASSARKGLGPPDLAELVRVHDLFRPATPFSGLVRADDPEPDPQEHEPGRQTER